MAGPRAKAALFWRQVQSAGHEQARGHLPAYPANTWGAVCNLPGWAEGNAPARINDLKIAWNADQLTDPAHLDEKSARDVLGNPGSRDR